MKRGHELSEGFKRIDRGLVGHSMYSAEFIEHQMEQERGKQTNNGPTIMMNKDGGYKTSLGESGEGVKTREGLRKIEPQKLRAFGPSPFVGREGSPISWVISINTLITILYCIKPGLIWTICTHSCL